jgi:P-type conjugative transfer protein TrbJ
MSRAALKNHLIASTMALGALTGALLPAPRAQAQIAVFDPNNYAQNLLSAARALQQINNQIQSLQNEAAMLRNMQRDLEQIDFPEQQALLDRLRDIDALIQRAQGIDFRTAQVEARFRALFPDFDARATSDARAAQARTRLDTAMAAFRHTMQLQAKIVEAVQSDGGTLAAIVDKSQNASGALQASQAANQLLALTAKQQMHIQQLLAAQFRADALEQARRVQGELDARAATRKFLGSGTAWTPR